MKQLRIRTLAGILVLAGVLSWAVAKLLDSYGALPSVPVAAVSSVLSTLAANRTAHASGAAARTLVVGFHWAFAGGAVFVAGALGTMLVLLRKRHVARIEAEAADPVMVNV